MNERAKILRFFWKKVGILLVLVPVLYLDGTHLASIFPYGQHVLTALVAIAFVIFYRRARRRIRRMYICILIFGPVLEYTMSLGLGMYTYRLGYVPIYAFFMHAICIGRIFEFSRFLSTTLYDKIFIKYLYGFIIIHSLISLIIFNDIFGFVMTLGVIVLLAVRPKYRVFFLTWHVLVTFGELSGVFFEAWSWPSIAFGVFDFLPSHSPPSGISLFYYILELGAFLLYILVYKDVWSRFKNIKKYQLMKA